MEPIARKAGVAGTGDTRQALSEKQKTRPSQFDLLRADLNQKLGVSAQLPPHVTSISDQQKDVLAADLRRKLEVARDPQELFDGDVKQLESGIADLNHRVAAIPDNNAFAPLRQRLKSIESDFHSSTKLLRNIGSLDDPQRLLEMQIEMYKIAHNVEIMSRTLSEVTSGVKTILQTQI